MGPCLKLELELSMMTSLLLFPSGRQVIGAEEGEERAKSNKSFKRSVVDDNREAGVGIEQRLRIPARFLSRLCFIATSYTTPLPPPIQTINFLYYFPREIRTSSNTPNFPHGGLVHLAPLAEKVYVRANRKTSILKIKTPFHAKIKPSYLGRFSLPRPLSFPWTKNAR
ncbi:hypothetical protein F5X99DRAFT_270974 [Biscogniauxia marginata]|nr:hypothetical protein F5X99DRAFT_270974 [Biscogniauxia marginata]